MKLGPQDANPTAHGDSGESERRPPLLLLCHRIPYPPDKGDKIRSFHILRYLADHYDVYLGTFVDDPDDWVYAPTVRSYCKDVFFAPLDSRWARVSSLKGLALGAPLSLPYYDSSDMRDWARAVVDTHQILRRVVFSSVMGQFLPPARPESRTLIDFVDVDSDKWEQFAASKRGPMAWIYRREARLLAGYEASLAESSDMSLFVSEAEAEFFRTRTGQGGQRCSFFNNGVDSEYFDPALYLSQGDAVAPELVFTGAMDYWPNVDAVQWFAKSVLPSLQRDIPELQFTIVGGNPSNKVLELRELPGVSVTGRVPDVRPYISRAFAVVAPMRVARGIQNKVLEAMAMAKPVLVSSMGLEGIQAADRREVLIANEPGDYQRHLLDLQQGKYSELGCLARTFVVKNFSWESSLAPLHTFLEGEFSGG